MCPRSLLRTTLFTNMSLTRATKQYPKHPILTILPLCFLIIPVYVQSKVQTILQKMQRHYFHKHKSRERMADSEQWARLVPKIPAKKQWRVCVLLKCPQAFQFWSHSFLQNSNKIAGVPVQFLDHTVLLECKHTVAACPQGNRKPWPTLDCSP